MGFFDFLKRSPRKKKCIRCGQAAAHGYSKRAESESKQIAPLCLACLISQLRHDYADFRGRAVVVAPAAGLPCYVFRELASLGTGSSGPLRDIASLLDALTTCSTCGKEGRCLWIESRGLDVETFENVFELGPRDALLKWGNPKPLPLCGKCTAERIGQCLGTGDFEFFEVTAPSSDLDGIVMPVAY